MNEVYAQVLEASGYDVTREPPPSDATSLFESLRVGAIDLSAVVVSEVSAVTSVDPAASNLEDLRTRLGGEGLRLLEASGAERGLGVAMRREDADQARIAT